MVGVLAIVAAVLGFLYYQERQNSGAIQIGGRGATIDGK
jgi:hypothetical protein